MIADSGLVPYFHSHLFYFERKTLSWKKTQLLQVLGM